MGGDSFHVTVGQLTFSYILMCSLMNRFTSSAVREGGTSKRRVPIELRLLEAY